MTCGPLDEARMDETEPQTFDEDPGRDDTDDLPDVIVAEPLVENA